MTFTDELNKEKKGQHTLSFFSNKLKTIHVENFISPSRLTAIINYYSFNLTKVCPESSCATFEQVLNLKAKPSCVGGRQGNVYINKDTMQCATNLKLSTLHLLLPSFSVR